MRWAMLLVLLAGCGGKPNGEPVGQVGEQPVQPTTRKEVREESLVPAKSPPLTDFSRLFADYNINEVAADALYKDKRGRLVVMVNTIGRSPSGVAFIGQWTAAGKEPGVFFYFDKAHESDLKTLTPWDDRRTVEATCRGKRRDGINRGVIGMDWRIEFTECRVVGPAPKE